MRMRQLTLREQIYIFTNKYSSMYIGLYMTLLLILTIHEQLKINSFKAA